MNTEIGKTGEVIVEGHAIGRLDGFTFAPDAAEAGSDAKALQAAAQQVLAREIDARAEKLSGAPDDAFVLTSDGTIRWTGDAVAKLAAAEDALHPRVRIVSDERLTGAPREAVQARLDLWLKTHIHKLLGPLFDLSKAEDITGIARGIAFQLVEALGVLERSKISAEMKDLDQPSRASLRKYGVRFGAYHIYFPQLLKPAARSLAALLWAEKQDNVDTSALSSAQHLAGSGRTSFPVDKALPRDAYRVLGYKQSGERAVRVDILERLADLIRPALAWRENSPGAKPPGAFDGRGFVVTQAMTSLTGSAGEDFASVLRALGYRMDRRPPLPPKPVEPVVVETVAADAPPAEATAEAAVAESSASEPAVEAAAETAVADVAVDQPVSEEAPPSAEQMPDVTLAPETTVEPVAEPEAEAPAAAAAVEPDAEAVDDAAPEPALETAASDESASTEAAPADAPSADAAPAEASAAPAAAAEAPATPELVEVWRPGGRSDERPRHARHRHRGQPAQAGAQAGAGEGGEGAERQQHHRRRRPDFRKPRDGAPAEAASAEAAPARDDKGGRRERFEGKGRDRDNERRRDKSGGERKERDRGREFGRDKGGRDKGRESGPSHRQYASSAPRDRERAIDPNSPFAKLAALKEQLAANRKD